MYHEQFIAPFIVYVTNACILELATFYKDCQKVTEVSFNKKNRIFSLRLAKTESVSCPSVWDWERQMAWKPVTEIGNLNVAARRKVMPKNCLS